MSKKTFFGILTVCLVFSFALGIKNVLAIGQMTEPIIIKEALRGQEIPQKITLINSETKPIVFKVVGDGQIKDWVSFYKEDDLKTPVTELEVSASFYYNAVAKFKIPNDIPNGTYTGNINVLYTPEQKLTNQSATIGQKVSRSVTITVSDKEVVDIQAQITAVNYEINNGQPAQIKLIYDNKGNISVKPSTQLKVFDSANNQIFNAIFPYPDNLEVVKAGERKEMPLIEWQTAGQKDGNYLVEVSVLLNEKLIKTEPITFTLKPGRDLPLANVGGVAGSFAPIWFIAGGIFLILIFGLIFLILKKKNN